MKFRLCAAAVSSCVTFVFAAHADEPAELPALPAPLETPAPAPEPVPVQAQPTTPEPTPAPTPPPRWRRQPVLTGGLALGIGAPSGWLGGTVSFSPVDRVAIAAELGLGTNGVQSALMLHAFPFDMGKDSDSVGRGGVGLGVSTGTYADHNVGGAGYGFVYFRRAWFLNVEATMLAWHRLGVEAEFAVGAAVLLNRGDGVCSVTTTCTPLGFDPYLAFRFRFGGWL